MVVNTFKSTARTIIADFYWYTNTLPANITKMILRLTLDGVYKSGTIFDPMEPSAHLHLLAIITDYTGGRCPTPFSPGGDSKLQQVGIHIHLAGILAKIKRRK